MSDWINDNFRKLRVCVLIPTYNNAATLPGLLDEVLTYTDQVIVINDGSTDTTLDAISGYGSVTLITYSRNKGKGWAIRSGMKKALEMGFNYAITMDSDGQHFASDLPAFIKELEKHPEAIIIGARNMEQESVPGKSSFGNKFSNFWFHFETGLKLPDTQSGFRLYPISKMGHIHFMTRRYEFEIEVLVRSAWMGIPVRSIPVRVYYAPAEERISHFRPVIDFARISVLNTVLVTITILYIWPRNFLRYIKKKTSARSFASNYLVPTKQMP